MVEKLKGSYLKDPRVVEAMLKVERHKFLPLLAKRSAYEDRPLSIGEGQTISAPHMVAAMSDLIDLKEGQKILEIGTGSGYQAAILAELVGPSGKVVTVERHGPLVKRALDVLKEWPWVEVIHYDGTIGYPAQAPYPRIMVTCAAAELPPALVEQLAVDGKMLCPVGKSWQDLMIYHKQSDGNIKKEKLMSVIFVPLVEGLK
jgi:protein-L-isoaspartate(D-aspartate) O-methyltransferase